MGEWSSSQLISSKVVVTDKVSVTDKVMQTKKVSATDNILPTDKMSATDRDLATNQHKLAATFAFRGFMGNYRLRLLQGPVEIGTLEMVVHDDVNLQCSLD